MRRRLGVEEGHRLGLLNVEEEWRPVCRGREGTCRELAEYTAAYRVELVRTLGHGQRFVVGRREQGAGSSAGEGWELVIAVPVKPGVEDFSAAAGRWEAKRAVVALLQDYFGDFRDREHLAQRYGYHVMWEWLAGLEGIGPYEIGSEELEGMLIDIGMRMAAEKGAGSREQGEVPAAPSEGVWA